MVDFLLIVMYLALVATLVLAVWSAWHSMKRRDKSQRVVNRIPVMRIVYIVIALLVGLLLLTFLCGSSSPMAVNGDRYDTWFWLKASDMFIVTAIVLIFIAIVGVVISFSGYFRKR
ncbi:MAG: hypothetical protein K5893_01845 [Prevotella sp.]|nr:hypothetical protein [Prevotella sp.]